MTAPIQRAVRIAWPVLLVSAAGVTVAVIAALAAGGGAKEASGLLDRYAAVIATREERLLWFVVTDLA